MNSIGFDIGGTKVYSAYGNDETLHDMMRFPTPQDMTSLLELLGKAVNLYGKEAKSVGIGIGIAGAKKPDGTLWVPNIPYLTGVNLEMLLEERLGMKAIIENDAHAALIGEKWIGCAKNVQNAVLIAIGTGIGGAFLMDGRIVKGEHAAAGSLGWLPFGIDFPNETMLHYEEVASGNALNSIACKDNTFENSKELLAAYRMGDAEARKRFLWWASCLGYGIASIASMMDVERIILTGGITEEFDLIAPVIQDKIKAFASPLNQNAAVCPSSLGDKAVLYGALRLGQTIKNNRR